MGCWPSHLKVIDTIGVGTLGVVVQNAQNGITIGGKFIADDLIIRTSWLLPSFVVPVSMIIHVLAGNARDFPFFISEADYPGVERMIFTVGLAISGLIQMLFAYRMWFEYRKIQPSKLLTLALCCGVFTGANLLVMSFADMYDHFVLHVITASMVFQVGMVWAVVSHFAIPNANPRGKRIRRLSILVSVVSYVIMNNAVVRAINDLEEYGLDDDTIFTLDRIQDAIDVAAYAEYALFVGLILCLYSFEQDFIAVSKSIEE